MKYIYCTNVQIQKHNIYIHSLHNFKKLYFVLQVGNNFFVYDHHF